MFHTNLYCAIAAKIAGVPVFITTEHGKNLWKTNIHHWVERRIISPLSLKRVAVSEDIRAVRVQSGDISFERIKIIAPCVVIPDQPIKLRKKQNFTIGTVGRMVEAKDLPTLIRSFAMLHREHVGIKLVLVGDGPLRSSLEQMAEQLGCKDKIEFAGFQKNIIDWLKKFDVFVLSSIQEGIPVAMLEAMAACLPIIATSVGGIPEVIDSGINGILVEPENPEKMAEAIATVMKDFSFRKKMAQEGRNTAKKIYSQSAICNQYKNLYLNLLEQTYVKQS